MKLLSLSAFLLLFSLKSFACTCNLKKFSKHYFHKYEKIFIGKIVDSLHYFSAEKGVEVIEYKIVMSKKLKVLEDYKGDTIIVRSEKDSCEFEGHIGSEYLFFVLAEDMINMCNHTILYHPFYQRRCKKLMRKVYRMQRRFYPLNPPLAQASTLVPISLKPVASV